MSLILSLETSTSVCSVALHENGKLLAFFETHREQSHASKLAVMIEQVINFAEVELNQLHAVAVSSGPGSYTGLRIGTSTAKGICYALDIPLIAIGTLALLASQVREVSTSDAYLCPMIDARRMEVYCQLFDDKENIIQGVEAKVIDHESFKEHLDNSNVLFFGNGAMKCQAMITHKNALFLDTINPTAKHLGSMAWKKFEAMAFEDLASYQPVYLKEFMIKLPLNG